VPGRGRNAARIECRCNGPQRRCAGRLRWVQAPTDITSNTYWDWTLRHAFLAVPTQALVAKFIGTFGEFPPRQKPSSFSVDDIMEQLSKPQGC
jgi:hypothetical protein